MKSFLKSLSVFCLLTISASVVKAQISIDNTITVTELVNNYLLGDGVNATNITFNGIPGDSVNLQIGLYTGPSDVLDFDEGIVMATVDVLSIQGGFGGPINGIQNDPDLVAISGQNIFDAAVLEFDFVPTGDSLSFEYVFASREYPSYTCTQFNDAFGFFLSGPGISGPFTNDAINIALIPGTDIPVAINTVNGGAPTGGGQASTCEAANPNWIEDSQYFVFNNAQPAGDIQFPGLTVTLPAVAEVQCGEEYHIKLAIGDAADGALDSGVFLRSGSFISSSNISIVIVPEINGVPVTQPGFENVLIRGCGSATINLVRPTSVDEVTAFMSLGGDAVLEADGVENPDYSLAGDTIFEFLPGVDTLSFIVTALPAPPTGTPVTIIFTLNVVDPCTGDTIQTSAELQIIDPYPINSETEDVVVTCPADSTVITALGLDGIEPYTYVWSEVVGGDTTGFGASIFVDVPPDQQTFYVQIVDVCNLVAIIDSVTVFNEIPPPLTLVIPEPEVPTCPGDDVEITAIVTDGNPEYTFIWNPTSANENTTTVNFETTQMVYLEVVDICGTTRNDSVLAVYPVYDPIVATFDSISISCPNDTVFAVANVEGGAGVFSYAWFDTNPDTPGNTPFSTDPVAVFQPGIGSKTFTLVITDQCGEQDRDSHTYFYLFLPVDSVSVVDEANCAGTELRWAVNEVYGGEPPFEFIWSGPGLLQELDSTNGSALFTRPENEEYALRLIDRCGFYPNNFNFEPDIVFLDKMPNVLTPNNDGKNDFLVIEGIERFPGSTLEVWDRWGKSVFKSTDYRAGSPLVQTTEAFTGKDLSDGTYFFILSISGGECTKSGYITLLGSND